ncbi:ATP12 family protein [uncultured Bartonella sp.]|uniref:ATP12 family chaperone protein n=1 Tax=uncultured Bartonella sp. TaxID=104108 RepID=UPI0025D85143|nr:ATP12 family protein [uncultured Bartonella sp.]
MREFLEDLNDEAEKADPVKQAQLLSKPQLPKRFYKQASVAEKDGGFAVLLDGKTVKTPARNGLVLPNRILAEIIASEFEAQQHTIDPAKMPATRLVNSIVDGVKQNMEAVLDEIVKFVGNDMLFYRAESPKELVKRQHLHWDPVLEWVQKKYGARFILTQGVMFVEQPDDSISAIRAHLRHIDSPYVLAALHSITTLCGSALLALAVSEGGLNLQEAWKLAHLDEDWTIEHWGEDVQATRKRAYHQAEYEAAVSVLASFKK